MQVLVNGASGFLASRLIADLSRDHRVVAQSRHPHRVRVADNVRVIESLQELNDGEIDAVVNLAGLNLGCGRWNETLRRAFVESRVETTRHLVTWMASLARPPEVLLSQSAVGYYGARGDEELDEDSSPGNEYQAWMCQVWENAAEQAQGNHIRVCRLRSGVVLDADGGPLPGLLPPFRYGLGGWLGDGRQWMSWIHRRDWLDAVRFLLQRQELSGVFNLTAPEPVRNREFAMHVGAAMHRPVWLPVPAWLVRARIGGMARLFLTGQRVRPARLENVGFRFRFPDPETALGDLLVSDGRTSNEGFHG